MKVLVALLTLVIYVDCHGGGGGGADDPEGRPISSVVTFDKVALKLNDSKWTAGRLWYLEAGTKTHNVLPAWSNCLRGSRNITVAVVGDGVYYLSADLKPNYNKVASHNLVDDNQDPLPASGVESSGTKAASLVAAAANDKCGVGVAFNASIAGIRYDYKDTAKFDENLAAALTKKLDQVDVFVGGLVKGLGKTGPKTAAALDELVTKGRSGRGAILFWPSGDGGGAVSCALDSMVNDVRTISLASINRRGEPLTTSQSCGALLACAYSADAGSEDPLITVSTDGSCVSDFYGSVPSAALGAGIIALALEANRNLSWRDVQHLIILTANPIVLPEKCAKNGIGKRVCDGYGYGLVDAYAITMRARTWPPVSAQRVCHIPATMGANGAAVNFNQKTACSGDQQIKYLEHVQVTATAADVTNDVSIWVTSPSGTGVILVSGVKGINATVTSVAFWGEQEKDGDWIISVAPSEGKLTKLILTLYGTLDEPGAMSSGYHFFNDFAENSCPVLGPFQTQRPATTDFTPLYIFIFLVAFVVSVFLGVTVYRRYISKLYCSGCRPSFRQVPQNADMIERIDRIASD